MPPKKAGATKGTRSSARNKASSQGGKKAEDEELHQQKLDDYMDEDVKVDAGTKRTKDEAELEDTSTKTPSEGKHAERGENGKDEVDGGEGEPAAKKVKTDDTAAGNGHHESETKGGHTPDLGEPSDGILERGHIYFFYRTKVDLGTDGTTPGSIDDVAKFHFLLLPTTTSDATDKATPKHKQKQAFRFVVIGKKRLPDPSKGKREVFWGSVERFGDDFASERMGEDDGEEGGLGERNYETKTRGSRHIDPARVVGRGHYALFSPSPKTPSARATHLVYFLTHPTEEALGDVQRELSIYPSGSFVVQVRNPTSSQNPPGVGLSANKRADYPEEVIEERFGGDADHAAGRKFVAANPVGLMDFVGAELLLIGDKHGAVEVLEEGGGGDEEVAKEMDREAEVDAEEMSSEDVLKELRLDHETFPCDALEGRWL